MKNQISILLVLSIVLFSACKKENIEQPVTPVIDTPTTVEASELFSLLENGVLRNVSLHYAEVVNNVIALQQKLQMKFIMAC